MQYFNHIQCRIVRKELYKPKIKLLQRQQHKREANGAKGSGDPLRKFPLITVADLSGGARDVPLLSIQIFSFSYSFWQKCCQIIDWRTSSEVGVSCLGNPGTATATTFMGHEQWRIQDFWEGGNKRGMLRCFWSFFSSKISWSIFFIIFLQIPVSLGNRINARTGRNWFPLEQSLNTPLMAGRICGTGRGHTASFLFCQ